MVTVVDGYSRFILPHRLQWYMTSDSLIKVVQESVERTGMNWFPIADRTRLLSDNGPGYFSGAFRDYLGMGASITYWHPLSTFRPTASWGVITRP